MKQKIRNLCETKEKELFAEERAQGALEYLLIIIGAVVIVSVVALYIKSAASSATENAQGNS